MEGDPYEEPDAKIILPVQPSKNGKLIGAGLFIAGVIVFAVILSNVISVKTPAKQVIAKPVPVITPKNRAIVMGQNPDPPPPPDPYAESAGVPRPTRQQEAAERGERYQKPQETREQASLDSSPISVDFSDYFDKDKAPADVKPAAKETDKPKTDKAEFDSATGKLFRLMEDTILETVLVNRLTGASVGPVISMVTTDVYSSSGNHMLIPRGTRLLGSVASVGSVNQERLFVACHRMIMPDGYSVSLDKFQGLDVVGQTGLRDLVNHHYVQIFGTSIVLAAVGAASQVGSNTGLGSYNWGTEMRAGVSQGLSESAQRVMERFLNVLPTFTVRERTRVKYMLSGDLLLPDVENHTMDPDF